MNKKKKNDDFKHQKINCYIKIVNGQNQNNFQSTLYKNSFNQLRMVDRNQTDHININTQQSNQNIKYSHQPNNNKQNDQVIQEQINQNMNESLDKSLSQQEDLLLSNSKDQPNDEKQMKYNNYKSDIKFNINPNKFLNLFNHKFQSEQKNPSQQQQEEEEIQPKNFRFSEITKENNKKKEGKMTEEIEEIQEVQEQEEQLISQQNQEAIYFDFDRVLSENESFVSLYQQNYKQQIQRCIQNKVNLHVFSLKSDQNNSNSDNCELIFTIISDLVQNSFDICYQDLKKKRQIQFGKENFNEDLQQLKQYLSENYLNQGFQQNEVGIQKIQIGDQKGKLSSIFFVDLVPMEFQLIKNVDFIYNLNLNGKFLYDWFTFQKSSIRNCEVFKEVFREIVNIKDEIAIQGMLVNDVEQFQRNLILGKLMEEICEKKGIFDCICLETFQNQQNLSENSSLVSHCKKEICELESQIKQFQQQINAKNQDIMILQQQKEQQEQIIQQYKEQSIFIQERRISQHNMDQQIEILLNEKQVSQQKNEVLQSQVQQLQNELWKQNQQLKQAEKQILDQNITISALKANENEQKLTENLEIESQIPSKNEQKQDNQCPKSAKKLDLSQRKSNLKNQNSNKKNINNNKNKISNASFKIEGGRNNNISFFFKKIKALDSNLENLEESFENLENQTEKEENEEEQQQQQEQEQEQEEYEQEEEVLIVEEEKEKEKFDNEESEEFRVRYSHINNVRNTTSDFILNQEFTSEFNTTSCNIVNLNSGNQNLGKKSAVIQEKVPKKEEKQEEIAKILDLEKQITEIQLELKEKDQYILEKDEVFDELYQNSIEVLRQKIDSEQKGCELIQEIQGQNYSILGQKMKEIEDLIKEIEVLRFKYHNEQSQKLKIQETCQTRLDEMQEKIISKINRKSEENQKLKQENELLKLQIQKLKK